MTLWIDADAAPQAVKEICLRASERLKLPTVLVANQRLQLPSGYANVSAVRVDGGADVADRYIVEHAGAGDVAVTADIPLAALLVPKEWSPQTDQLSSSAADKNKSSSRINDEGTAG